MSSDRERLEALLGRAEELVEQAKSTDYVMPVVLPFAPAILVVMGFILVIVGLVGMTADSAAAYVLFTGLAVLFAGIAVNFYVVYKWVARRNAHFRRSLQLFEVLAEVAELLRFRRSYAVRSRLNELRVVNSRTRSALANALLIVVPLYIYYVFHFLNKDFSEHSVKEKLLVAELLEDLRERMPSFARRPDEFAEVPSRSTFLYLILTWVTGLFMLYWVYTLTKDPNQHFESHAVLEHELITALKHLSTQTT